MSYVAFGSPAPVAGLELVSKQGATPIITWEPWQWGGGIEQRAYSLARITGGSFDTYLKQWGAELGAWGKPVMLRFGHEMNGGWYPWGDGVNGNGGTDFVQAWKHVHDVVRGAGATNVQWVWTPNIDEPGQTADMARFYPGPEYTDFVGLDGYNWGTTFPHGKWVTPQMLFGAGLAQLHRLAPGKPILIAETGSGEDGGSKPEWVSSLVSYLAAQPGLIGFIWFDLDKERDWRIDSSAQSAAAFARALAARH